MHTHFTYGVVHMHTFSKSIPILRDSLDYYWFAFMGWQIILRDQSYLFILALLDCTTEPEDEQAKTWYPIIKTYY